MKRFATRRLITILCASGMLGVSSHAMAAAFQLWEQDGASIANVHAGYAAEANDASTAWYNPAGMTRIKKPQVVFGADPILSDFKYKGDIAVTEVTPTVAGLPPTLSGVASSVNFPGVTDQGGNFAAVPFFHFVTPITDRLAFGVSTVSPFGLKTSYGSDTPVRYAATYTSVMLIDLTPSLAFRVTDQFSVGAGFNIQRMYGEFDSFAAAVTRPAGFIPPIPVPIQFAGDPEINPARDSESTNKANGWGYGYNLGILYELTPCSRIGLAYHSKVDHHLTGNSVFEGPIAGGLVGLTTFRSSELRSQRATADVTLPAYTTLSYFTKVNPAWAWMASLTYIQWDVFKVLTLNGAAGAVPSTTLPFFETSTNFQVNIPQHYRNVWNLSIGANWYATDSITLRTGIGYDESPVRDAFRNMQLPDSDRYLAAIGTHFQATRTIGLDLSYQHVFTKEVKLNPPPQPVGAQVVSTDGKAKGGADVFGAQVVWDLC